MHDLAPLTAMGGTAPVSDHVAGVTLTENPDLALASVMARIAHVATCEKHLKAILGASAPGPGKAVLNDPEAAIWVGPDQWMLCAPFSTHEEFAAQLKERFGASASVTEQTDAWVCFDLVGDGVEAVMELCCNLDIRTMTMGDAQRTSIHHLGCLVVHMGPAECLRIMGPRSSAHSLHHAIKTAMTSAL